MSKNLNVEKDLQELKLSIKNLEKLFNDVKTELSNKMTAV